GRSTTRCARRWWRCVAATRRYSRCGWCSTPRRPTRSRCPPMRRQLAAPGGHPRASLGNVSTSPGMPQSNLDLELLAAELRKHSDDLALYAGLVLGVLSAALPPELVQVRREGKLKAR